MRNWEITDQGMNEEMEPTESGKEEEEGDDTCFLVFAIILLNSVGFLKHPLGFFSAPLWTRQSMLRI